MRSFVRRMPPLFLFLAYSPTAAAPLLEDRAEPAPAHRKESSHDDEGERDNPSTESAQPIQAAAAGATGPSAVSARMNAIGSLVANVTVEGANGPTGPSK